MEGRTCDRCKRSFFNLQSDEPEGCVPCFCFGLTNDCKCANYYKDTVRMLASLSDLQSSPGLSKAGFLFFLSFLNNNIVICVDVDVEFLVIPTIEQSNSFFSAAKKFSHWPESLSELCFLCQYEFRVL